MVTMFFRISSTVFSVRGLGSGLRPFSWIGSNNDLEFLTVDFEIMLDLEETNCSS